MTISNSCLTFTLRILHMELQFFVFVNCSLNWIIFHLISDSLWRIHFEMNWSLRIPWLVGCNFSKVLPSTLTPQNVRHRTCFQIILVFTFANITKKMTAIPWKRPWFIQNFRNSTDRLKIKPIAQNVIN